MEAIDVERLASSAPLTCGYRFELIRRDEVAHLIEQLTNWYRDISVGAASCFLQHEFYSRKVFFQDATDRECIVLALKHGDELVGMFSCELHSVTRSIYAGLGVAHPSHRGTRLAQAGMAFVETLADHLGVGFIFGMATLKHPYAQRAFERAGWQLVGITPGYDRELIAPGIVKRVYEAVYAKVLAGEGLLNPDRDNLTPRTRALFDSLFHCDTALPELEQSRHIAYRDRH
jgi:hypothetical protein